MKKALYILAAMMLLTACKEKVSVDSREQQAPEILSFAPLSGAVGTEVTIRGNYLGQVDTVLFGGAYTPLRYRVSDKEIVVEVAANSQSGLITVKNIVGSAISAESFTMNYLVPEVDVWPTNGIVYQQVVIEGKNLQAVSEVKLGDLIAPIVAKRPKELVFEVPFRDEETPVALRLSYYNAEGAQQIGPAGETFVIEKQSPIVKNCPTTLTKYEPIIITGELLNLFDSLKVGDEPVMIISKNDEEMVIDMPTNYFGGEMTADLVGWYYGVKTKVVCPDFHVISDPNEPRYYTYKNVVLSARSQNGGSDMPFFDGETGMVISTCEAEGQMMAIDFLLYDNTDYAQLYSPSNATNTLKNFKCDGVSIVSDASVWAEFFKVDTKFRVLDPANATQKAVIDAYEAGTIVELNDDFFTGISAPSSKAPKVYLSNDQVANLSVDHYPYAYIRNFATGKNAIMKLTDVKYNETAKKYYEITFDIIWSK